MNSYIKENIDNSLTYFKYVLNLRRSKIAYIILCLAIIPRVIWMTKDVIPNEIIFQTDLNQSINDFAEMLSLFKLNFIKVLSITWIFLVISIFEFSKSHNLRKLSLARIFHSKGGKYADLIYFLLSQFGFKLRYLNVIGTLGIARISGGFSDQLNSIYKNLIPNEIFSKGLGTYIVFILALLLFEFGEYLSHRISHSFLWELHEFHHSATEMTILNVNRGSILEGALKSLFTLPIMLLAVVVINNSIEQGQWVIFTLWTIFGIAGELFGYVGHSSLKLIFPKPISYIFLSPSLHWLHHSNNPKHFNKNFGRVLCIWDKLFGTYMDESHLNEIKFFGVDNSDYNKFNPFFSYYILPLKKLFTKIRKLFYPILFNS